jgi:hypothetical protein
MTRTASQSQNLKPIHFKFAYLKIDHCAFFLFKKRHELKKIYSSKMNFLIKITLLAVFAAAFLFTDMNNLRQACLKTKYIGKPSKL